MESKSKPTHGRWFVCLFAPVLFVCTGCAAMFPGLQTQQALRQEKTYGWGETGAFTVTGMGSQTERFVMAQGDIVLNEDGTVNVAESKIEYYLKADPSADNAASAMGLALKASTEQTQIIGNAFNQAMQLVGPILARGMVSPGSPTPVPEIAPVAPTPP